MTISSAVQSQFFPDEQRLIRIPLTMSSSSSSSLMSARSTARSTPGAPAATGTHTNKNGAPWTTEEHNRFLEALEKFPSGPWKLISAHVATRTTRQTMTHAQKYREKIARHNRAQDMDALLLAGASRAMAARKKDQSASATAKVKRKPVQEPSLLSIDNAVERRIEGERENEEVHLESCVEAAIKALLDEYEPFDLLDGEDASLTWDLQR